jgi:hypothetical protein
MILKHVTARTLEVPTAERMRECRVLGSRFIPIHRSSFCPGLTFACYNGLSPKIFAHV